MTTMSDSHPPRAKHRWYQFSLRTLLLFVLVAGIGFGLFGRELEHARHEKKAAEELRKLGAGLDDWPGWQEIVFGRDYPPIVQVNLRGTREIDAALEHLAALEHIEDLGLSGTSVSDADLENLKKLTSLVSLDLRDTAVSDSGLEHLKGLTGLRWLKLTGTQVTEKGVEKLQQALPNCEIRH